MEIGVLGNPDSWYVERLSEIASVRGHRSHRLAFDSLVASVSGSAAFIRSDDVVVNSLDVLIVRTMPPGTLEQVVTRMNLLQVAEQSGVRVINSPKSLECAVDKYLTTQRLAMAGLPVPRTVVCESSDLAMMAYEQLGGDVVVKPLFGSEGRGILRVSDPELALRTFRTLSRLGAVLYLQEFVHGPGFDLRLLLLDGQLIGSMKRTPKPGDFRANISQQGTGTVHSATKEELELSQQAADVVGCTFAGVDLMYDRDGQIKVIEVNAIPGWRGLEKVCGIDVSSWLFGWLERTGRPK